MHTKKQNMIRWGLYRETYVVLVSPEETELHLGTYFFLLPPINLFVCCFPQIRELTFFIFISFHFPEHCVDYLRQYIQCNADLTPMWTGDMGGGHLMVKPYTPHTCRDFDQITQWIDDHRV